MIGDFGASLTAFYADVRGQLDQVTLVTMSEFGRRVRENASRGTDHGHGNVMFVMGGGVRGAFTRAGQDSTRTHSTTAT